MELTAVIEALRALRQRCEVSLYSDSKYVIDALGKGWVYNWRKNNWIKGDKKPALNPDLWEALLKQMDRHQVNLYWVKGHSSNPQNARCDELAVAESKKYKHQGIHPRRKQKWSSGMVFPGMRKYSIDNSFPITIGLFSVYIRKKKKFV